LIDFPTLVIGRVGAQCGNVHRSDGPAWITDNAIFAKSISPDVDLDFAVHFFRAADLNSLAGGTGQPYVNQSTLNDLEMPLPTIREQREIVCLIDRAYEWIDRLASETTSARKLIDHLDQAILAKAFRGELVPQDPADEPASVMLERIKAEREVKSPSRRPTVRKKKGKAGS
jgi:type I restriction enzyme S subunit